MNETSTELLRFIDASPSCFHVIENIKNELKNCTQLKETEDWNLEAGHTYYVTRSDSSVIFFRLPISQFKGYHIAAAHSDCPSFRIKPSPEMVCEKTYTKLNVEKYGGMIMSGWFDRPLSCAGRAIVKENGRLVSKNVNIDRDLLMIPNVAIHMNRKINDGYSYNPQIDLLPLFGGPDAKLMPLICETLGVSEEAVYGTDLFLYNRMKGIIWGNDNEFISSRALDDLQCVFSILKGFVSAQQKTSDPSPYISMGCIFDNEEVGSLTKQGADSSFLSDTIDRINESLGFSVSKSKQMIANSFMISADNAHAVHPNHPELADPTNRPYINGGIVIKYNAAQKYTTDAVSESYFKDLCMKCEIPFQTYANRSDIAGGSTLGNLSNRHISMNTVDIGLAQLAMHSAYETAGAFDTGYLIRVLTEFFI